MGDYFIIKRLHTNYLKEINQNIKSARTLYSKEDDYIILQLIYDFRNYPHEMVAFEYSRNDKGLQLEKIVRSPNLSNDVQMRIREDAENIQSHSTICNIIVNAINAYESQKKKGYQCIEEALYHKGGVNLYVENPPPTDIRPRAAPPK